MPLTWQSLVVRPLAGPGQLDQPWDIVILGQLFHVVCDR